MSETRRSGINPLAYQGVEASAPPQFVYYRRNPTTHDYYNWRIGTLWLNQTINTLWMLVRLNNHVATWIQFGSGGGPFASSFPTDNLIALPTALGVVNVLGQAGLVNTDAIVANTITINLTGSANGNVLQGNGVGVPPIWGPAPGIGAITEIHVDGGAAILPVVGIVNIIGAHWVDVTATAGDTATVSLENAITLGDLAPIAADAGAVTAQTGDIIITAGDLTLPNTNAAGNQGIVKFGGVNWIHDYGTNNVFVGGFSGNQTLTVANAFTNTAIGYHTLESLTTGNGNFAGGHDAGQNLTVGAQNCLAGAGAGQALTSGTDNTFLGYIAGSGITTGDENICIGQSAGGSLAAADSLNIMIGDTGIAGDNLTLRIGNRLFPLVKTFILGIRGVVTDVADAVPVLVDSAGQLGTVSSSIRYKENVHDLGNASLNLYCLRPVTFNYKTDKKKTSTYGLIAEEVAEFMPEMVIRNDEGECETVKYDQLTTLLLNEIQRLEKRITAMEEKFTLLN